MPEKPIILKKTTIATSRLFRMVQDDNTNQTYVTGLQTPSRVRAPPFVRQHPINASYGLYFAL